MADQPTPARQIKEGVGEDVVTSCGTEDRLYNGLRILTVQFLQEVQADEEPAMKSSPAGVRPRPQPFNCRMPGRRRSWKSC